MLKAPSLQDWPFEYQGFGSRFFQGPDRRIPHSGSKAPGKGDSRNHGLQDPHVHVVFGGPYDLQAGCLPARGSPEQGGDFKNQEPQDGSCQTSGTLIYIPNNRDLVISYKDTTKGPPIYKDSHLDTKTAGFSLAGNPA